MLFLFYQKVAEDFISWEELYEKVCELSFILKKLV